MNGHGAKAHVEVTLEAIAADLRCHLASPAVLIGSAAACLAGADVDVQDIDLLLAADDAARLEAAWSAHRVADYAPARVERFRSRFSRYAFSPLPVEAMGDLEVSVEGSWQRLIVGDTVPAEGMGDVLLVPSVPEQLRVLALFGRDKDRVRAAQLQTLANARTMP